MGSLMTQSWEALEDALLLVYVSCVAGGAAVWVKALVCFVYLVYKALCTRLSARGICLMSP